MGVEFINDVLQPLAWLGGIAMIVWASARAKLEHRKLDIMRNQPVPLGTTPNEPIIAELKALQQQMAEMHSTSHQFDISFDEALSRLEGRVGRLETKSAAGTAAATTETPNTLRNGQYQ